MSSAVPCSHVHAHTYMCVWYVHNMFPPPPSPESCHLAPLGIKSLPHPLEREHTVAHSPPSLSQHFSLSIVPPPPPPLSIFLTETLGVVEDCPHLTNSTIGWDASMCLRGWVADIRRVVTDQLVCVCNVHGLFFIYLFILQANGRRNRSLLCVN